MLNAASSWTDTSVCLLPTFLPPPPPPLCRGAQTPALLPTPLSSSFHVYSPGPHTHTTPSIHPMIPSFLPSSSSCPLHARQIFPLFLRKHSIDHFYEEMCPPAAPVAAAQPSASNVFSSDSRRRFNSGSPSDRRSLVVLDSGPFFVFVNSFLFCFFVLGKTNILQCLEQLLGK